MGFWRHQLLADVQEPSSAEHNQKEVEEPTDSAGYQRMNRGQILRRQLYDGCKIHRQSNRCIDDAHHCGPPEPKPDEDSECKRQEDEKADPPCKAWYRGDVVHTEKYPGLDDE